MNNKCADQPEHPRSLISAFVARCLDITRFYSSKLCSSIGTYRQPISLRKASYVHLFNGERGGSVVECRTLEREVRGSRPTAAVLCPWARHFTPRKYWLITQEAMAPSRHDWKIVDWDVKPQHNQPTNICLSAKFHPAGTVLPLSSAACNVTPIIVHKCAGR